jgi:hypothetical protein
VAIVELCVFQDGAQNQPRPGRLLLQQLQLRLFLTKPPQVFFWQASSVFQVLNMVVWFIYNS